MSTILRTDNPFVLGKIINFKDGRKILVRDKLVYQPSVGDQLYVVKEGDTISDIAFRFYGNSKEYWIILDANPNILNPFILPLFETIIIPDKATTRLKL